MFLQPDHTCVEPMRLEPTDKYTKYFSNSYLIVDEMLTKLYPDGDMDIMCYEGCLVDNFMDHLISTKLIGTKIGIINPKILTILSLFLKNLHRLGQVVKKFISQMTKNGWTKSVNNLKKNMRTNNANEKI